MANRIAVAGDSAGSWCRSNAAPARSGVPAGVDPHAELAYGEGLQAHARAAEFRLKGEGA